MKLGAPAVLGAFLLTLVACTGTAGSGAGDSSPSSETGPDASGQDGYEVCWAAEASGDTGSIEFVDRTADFGLISPLIGMKAHAAAWGDIDGDGKADLIVGTFATASRSEVYLERGATGPAPDRVLIQGDGSFDIDTSFPEQFGRTSGVALVDLDGDGDLDLVLSRNVNPRQAGATTAIFENTGGGLVEVDSGLDPELGGRSVGVLDVDQDGLLDLVIVEDRYTGGSTRVYRNTGDLGFEDVTESVGFPLDVHGLGVATGDLNSDGFTDVFIAGSNRLFVGSAGGLTEAVGAIPEWETYGPEDDVAGAAIADVNRDGYPDLLIGHHFNSTLSRGSEVPVRLYLNSGDPGTVSFEDVTDASGLPGLSTKAPHVELADVDNDGWLDVVTSASAHGGTVPAIFRNEGLVNGVPTFATPDGLGSAQYWVTAPMADVDRDGRLDMLAVEWESSLASILFMNATSGGHWLDVTVSDRVGGVGTRVEVYQSGGSGEPSSLLGVREITATVGYTAGVELAAHFGLGDVSVVDIVLVPPAGGAPIELSDVHADRRIGVGGC